MDPIRTAVMDARLRAIVEEASAILYRTAHTTFVKLVQDFQCALATTDGEIVAYPQQSGVNAFIGLPLGGALDWIGRDTLKPGDCIITNDPFLTDGMVTHMMDVSMLRPIFRGGRMIACAWSYVHASDIGGGVPGSISPAFTEVFQEGVRIRPMRLYREGVLNEDVRDLILDNSRIPTEMWGDFQAMLAAMKNMERRLLQLCDRYGEEAVLAGMHDVLAFAEQKSRGVIARIPDGEYKFSDYLEGLEPGQFSHIAATMRVKGDELELDFTGTDPQVPAAYNFVIGDRPHPYIAQAVLFYVLTIEPDAPRNAGLLRPMKTIAPRGTIVNAEFPAAGGARVAASTRAYDVLLGCLAQAIPGGLLAAGPGMSAIIVVGADDPRTGDRRVSVINPICGGGGGRAGSDGVDAIDVRSGYLRSVPTEVIEAETVIHVNECRLVSDSHSPGRWRSGAALVLEMENTGLEATMTVRGMDRFHFRPWGVAGGRPGRHAEVVVNPGRPDARSIGKINVLKLKRGDVVRITTPAGGGFGDPTERDVGLIESDIVSGMVTRGEAERGYGVAFDHAGAIDREQTERRRALVRGGRNVVPPFSLGPERDAHDAVWPAEVRRALALKSLALGRALRQPVLALVRERLTTEGRPVDMDRLDAALDQAVAELGGASRHPKQQPKDKERRDVDTATDVTCDGGDGHAGRDAGRAGRRLAAVDRSAARQPRGQGV
jgi:N-methylhydantoinase B